MTKLTHNKGRAIAFLIIILIASISVLNSCRKGRSPIPIPSELSQSEVNNAFNNIVKNSEYLVGDKTIQLDWEYVERINKYGNNYVRYKLANNQELVFMRNMDKVKVYLNHTTAYKDGKDNSFTFILSTDLETSRTYVATYYENIRVAFLPIEDVLETMDRQTMLVTNLNIKPNHKNKISLSFPKDKLFASASLWEHIKCWIKFSVYRENGPDGPGCYWLDFAGIWDAVKELLNSDPDNSGSSINTVSIQPILNWGDATGLPDYGPPNSNNPQTPLPDNGNGPGVVDTGLSQYPPNQWDSAVAGQAPITTEVSQLVSGFNLERFYQEYLRYHDNAIATTLLNYTSANGGFTAHNGEFTKWAIDYLSENPDALSNELTDNNSLNITLSNLDASELNSYPKFKALVNDLPNFLSHYPNILKALSLTTGLTEKRIVALMQPGKGPKVIVVNNLKDANGNDVVGQFDDKNKILKIDNGYVNDLDIANTPTKYQAIGLILTITTLHEFVHFGRDANNLPKRMAGVVTGKGSYESGWYFEDIITAPGSNRLEPANAQEWLRYYRVKSRQ